METDQSQVKLELMVRNLASQLAQKELELADARAELAMANAKLRQCEDTEAGSESHE